MLAVERAAAAYRRRALAAVERDCRSEARELARRACTLHRSRDSLIARAVAALADGDFPLTLRLWREIRQDRATTKHRIGTHSPTDRLWRKIRQDHAT